MDEKRTPLRSEEILNVQVVVDTNVLFGALLQRDSKARQTIVLRAADFVTPRYLFVELFKHKERLLRMSDLSADELVEAFHILVMRLNFYNESEIPIGTWMRAYQLCGDVDRNDTAFVALALHLGARLWSNDDELKAGLRARGFDTFFPP